MIPVEAVLTKEFVQAAAGLLLCVLVDLVLGVSVAVKQRKFDLRQLADFYGAAILPNVLGWAIVDVLLRVGAFYELPVVTQLQGIFTTSLYGIALAALLAQITMKFVALRGDAQPMPTTK